jgi:hypothetical protein
MIRTYKGGCHCGAVRFRVRTDLARVSECNCSICTKKGVLHLPAEKSDFELLQGEDALATYEFNTKTAKHIFCRHCGIHAFNVPRLNPDRYSVNARCLDGVDLAALQPRLFDGRNWEEAARARRAEEAPAPEPAAVIVRTDRG